MATLDWVPSACTLPTEQQPLRVAEWDALFAEHLTAVTRPRALGLRLELLGDADSSVLERVSDLAAKESDCCSFFTFSVTGGRGDGSTVYLDVEVGSAHEAVLTALYERATAVAGADRP